MSLFYQFLLQAPPNLRDIKPPLEVQQSPLPYFFLTGGIFVVIITVSAWLYLRKRRQTSEPTPIEEGEVRPPHEIAYERLATIEGEKWPTQGDMDVYHIHISHVIREYIKARYRIPALELTTTQLLAQLANQPHGTLDIDKVRHFLANCDKVKFTTYQPAVSEATERMAEARWFVDMTKTAV